MITSSEGDPHEYHIDNGVWRQQSNVGNILQSHRSVILSVLSCYQSHTPDDHNLDRAEVTPLRIEGAGNPREVGDTRTDASMLGLQGGSLTSSSPPPPPPTHTHSKNGNF